MNLLEKTTFTKFEGEVRALCIKLLFFEHLVWQKLDLKGKVICSFRGNILLVHLFPDGANVIHDVVFNDS